MEYLQDALSHIGELANPQLISFLLLILILGDTLTSCLWRNKKHEPIFSKSLWVGFGLNLLGASVPYISGLFLSDLDSYFYTTAIIAWGIIFGIATLFSLIANYKLYSPDGYEAILTNAPKILTSEMENKINKTKEGINGQ